MLGSLGLSFLKRSDCVLQGCEVPEEKAAGCDGGSRREADERPVSANEELHEEPRRSWEIEVAAGR